ncbi:glycosyltransferase family 4 protein [Aestuariicella hydrocarbonica]|uniref:Glycosyltransferase family 4 protein n=1 Tax=Pseudomaricurvus hydrocarbonicus TaxID=1470433 RepID=A0A9E5JX53_9GAMM|nr:glycosyltransferase family 4 protein [Aestuariicella hydrocarbonica]NHO66550.1 glycosyltransferase family 4 protein [Aestuariicella hydrocarbonica]
MKLAFCLYKYFSFGGLQRDFLAVASECHRRGHQITAYVLEWQGEVPEWLEVVTVPVKGWASYRRYQNFTQWLRDRQVADQFDLMIGFNKMPDLDVYFAADPCFKEKALERSAWYQNSGRGKHFLHYEDVIFAPHSKTEILTIARNQGNIFQKYYATPEPRIHLLPPGIDPAYKDASEREIQRRAFRQEFQLSDDETLLLMVGSGFKTKGLDRALLALASLPQAQLLKTRFFIVGQDTPSRFKRQAKKLGVLDRVRFFAGRSDVRRFMFGADLMLHPAYYESAGKVLIESLCSGLPVLVTDVCGYAHYIHDAGAGQVLASPFSQDTLNQLLASMLLELPQQSWSENGLAFAQNHDLYSQPQYAADVIDQVLSRERS